MDTNAAAPGPDLQASAEQYLGYLEGFRRCAKTTLKAYGGDLAAFLACCRSQGLTTPAQVTASLLETYLGSFPSLSANTIRRRAYAVSGWLEHCARRRWIPTNPARGLQLPHRSRTERRFPAEQEVRGLLAAAHTPLETAAVWLLATTGVRRSELLDLDLDSLSPDGTEVRVIGKGRAERRLPLAETTQAVLAKYLAVRGSQPGPLLTTRIGTRLGATHLRRLFARLLRRAGLEDRGYSLHSMRHSFTTLLVRSGADLATIARLLGHLSLEVTTVYAHADPASCRAAVDALPILPAGGGGCE